MRYARVTIGETSFVLQDKYHGWLEVYVGDMVCYYWPSSEDKKTPVYENALRAAFELASLHKRFFFGSTALCPEFRRSSTRAH